MKKLALLLLLIFPTLSFAGGDSKAVDLISLKEVSKNRYTLTYKEMESKKTITIHLEYKAFRYLLTDFLSKDKYLKAIDLLKTQISENKPCRFGGAPCVVDKEKNIYRSDALDIYSEEHGEDELSVVYAFCEYL
jgi:hypothetical protein